MVYFFCRHKSAVLLTHLTEWVLLHIAVTDAFPGTAILFVDIRRSFIPVVLSACNRRMILTDKDGNVIKSADAKEFVVNLRQTPDNG